jgi:hypothetical protein
MVTSLRKDQPVWTAVYRGPEGAAFWDHERKAYADFARDDLPVNRVRGSGKIQWRVRPAKSGTKATVSLDDPLLGPMRHEVEFSDRADLAPFGPALYAALHCGAQCHRHSGLPFEELAKLGFVASEKTFLGDGRRAFSELTVEVLDVFRARPELFKPPTGFVPWKDAVRIVQGAPPDSEAVDQAAQAALEAAVQSALSNRGGYASSDDKVKEKFTPDCLGSTRFGSMAATVHQDLVDHGAAATNTVSPLLGSTTIAGGTWTIPWLASLAAIHAGSGIAPGSGIFCLLREPRRRSTDVRGLGGGTGLLDRIAWQMLTETDGRGRTRTEREFRDGTLAATLTAWGVSPETAAELTAAAGDMDALDIDERIEVVEGFETLDLGVVTIPDLPSTLGPFDFGSITFEGQASPPLFSIGVAGITGTVDFNGLGGAGMISAASVGNAGNVVLGLRLPTLVLNATITRALTDLGWVVLVLGTAGLCAALPFLCPMAVLLATLLAFVLNNITAVTVACTGVTMALDVRWRFDPATDRVEPFVDVVASTGTVTVTNTWVTPNIVANLIESLVASIGNLFNAWLGVFTEEFRKAMEDGLRRAGLQLPVRGRQLGLRCVAGGASSNQGEVLQLRADVRPSADSAVHPFVTQVATAPQMEAELVRDHLVMRRDLNPAAGPGAGLDTINVGTYLGLSLSQNVLNYYVFSQWADGEYRTATEDAPLIQELLALMPPNTFLRSPHRVHLWAATPPRIETAPAGIVAGERPLLMFFDDVRACFELKYAVGRDEPGFRGAWELSFNLKVLASVVVGFPFAFRVEADRRVRAVEVCDNRTWEFVDPNVLDVMSRFPRGSLDALVDRLGDFYLRRVSEDILGAPLAPRAWDRRKIALQQEVFDSVPPSIVLGAQQVYLDLLHRRKVLTVLPAVDTVLLELVDGSGAPRLNGILRLQEMLPAGGTVTALTMTCDQGDAVRTTVLPFLGLPAFP